ncbi:MAG TPA: hypothetical protein VFP60_17730 [Pseudolabrys sp.]|nr:hypothetical protein [Pseudolabrys sp.]
MSNRKTIAASGSEEANSEFTHDHGQTDLPLVEAPSVCPAEAQPETEAPVMPGKEGLADLSRPECEPDVPPQTVSTKKNSRFTAITAAILAPVARCAHLRLRAPYRRYASLAVCTAIAIVVGTIFGAIAAGFSKPASNSEMTKAAQESVARLEKEIARLKTSLDAVKKSTHDELVKLTERVVHDNGDVTGATKPQPVSPAAQRAPLPVPRPAAPLFQSPARSRIVSDWFIRGTRDGYVYVEGHGDIYQVVPGAPLPGLGPVEQIKRQDGRWMVVTSKGIIVSMRDRRHFDQF